MDRREQLLENIAWLARADFYNATPDFGGVSDSYRSEMLVGLELGELATFYFDACVPSAWYEANTQKHWFNFYDSEGLLEALDNYSYSEKLTALGFLILGSDQGGNPLLLDPYTGRLHVFQSGFLYGDKLSKLGKVKGRIEEPATRESIAGWSQTTWDGLDSFFEEVVDWTRRWHRGCILGKIVEADLAHLEHYCKLGLPIDMVDEEGRGPLEIAQQTGNKEVIGLVEKIMRETS